VAVIGLTIREEAVMDVLVERCAGLDVHRDTVQACIRVPGARGRASTGRRFGTVTVELLELCDWLDAAAVTLVAMEATGVYWKPVYYALEAAGFDVWLCNAQHIKNVPGRKTDVGDAVWIAQLLECGLVRPSFVPPAPIRELRELTRYRKTQVTERGREIQRLEKVLQDAGIKVSSVASAVLSKSSRQMVEALINGERDAEVLAEMAKSRLRAKIPELAKALDGHFGAHHAVVARSILDHLDFLDRNIEGLGTEIEKRLETSASAVNLLRGIPGVERRTAEAVIAEIGLDMTRFPTAGHLASWAGVCPGNNESGGKHRPARTRPGPTALQTALTEAARAAARSKGTYLAAQYARLAKRRGPNKASVAVAHSILVIVWHLLTTQQPYSDLGADYYVRRDSTDAYRHHLVRQLERLGHRVTLDSAA
jgi:transposase